MTSPQSQTPIRRRRLLQVSLRSFLVLLVLVSVGFGWLGIVVQRGREQRRAVLAIVDLGRWVSYHEPSNPIQRSESLRKLVGDETLLDAQEVTLGSCGTTDADLIHLKGLTQLDSLELSSTQVSDAGLVHLRGLTKLTLLNLHGSDVSVKGVEELKKALPICKIVWYPRSQTPPGESE